MTRRPRLEGGTALVTGAGSEDRGVTSPTHACDVADRRAMEALAECVHEEHWVLDVVVNNAGVGMSGRLADMSLDDWEWIRSINLDGVVHGCRLFGAPMAERGRGHGRVGRSAGVASVGVETVVCQRVDRRATRTRSAVDMSGRQVDRGIEEPMHEVVIIGAGLGGIGVAIELREAGIEDFVLLERASDIGGTWRDNTYPGVASDVPAQVYQYSFELNPDWSHVFAPGQEIMAYIRGLADKYGVMERVRLDSEVRSRTWDEEGHLWRLDTPQGEVTARYVVSAIGAFVDPKPVDIPGVERFAGATMHTASWDHDLDLRGKRVAMIGTGASAVQIIPEIADDVAHLEVFQRTPIWVGPKPDLPTPWPLRRLFRAVPAVQDAIRRLSVSLAETVLVGGVLQYQDRPRFADLLASANRNIWYRLQVRDPELRAALTPDYGFGCKRPSVSNQYLKTFTRDHVDLVTTPIEEVTPEGVRTRDGVVHEADVLILATGFRMATDPDIYERTPVRGRDGFDLATSYREERLRSYEGVALPGLPNHFIVFGPYGWIGGTWHQLVEIASAHAIRVITAAQRLGATSVEVRDEACERWTASMRERFGRSLFLSGGCATANSYYFDSRGDVPYLRPTSSAEAVRATASFPLDDYEFRSLADGASLDLDVSATSVG